MRAIELLQEGKENAVSRDDLIRATGLCDRMNRRQLKEELNHYPVNDQDGAGYYLADNDPAELRRYGSQEYARAMKPLATANRYFKRADEIESKQMKVEVGRWITTNLKSLIMIQV